MDVLFLPIQSSEGVKEAPVGPQSRGLSLFSYSLCDLRGSAVFRDSVTPGGTARGERRDPVLRRPMP